MDTLIITGATGYIGSQFIKKYHKNFIIYPVLKKESDIAAISNYTKPENFVYTDDLFKITDLNAKYFLHLAALNGDENSTSGINEMIHSNIMFPTQCLEAFMKGGGKYLVNIGSYWQHKDNKLNNPNSFYAATKESFESIVNIYAANKGLTAITLKLFDTYGPNDPRKKVLKLIKEAAQSGEEINMTTGKQLVNYTHVDDVVRGFKLALESISKLTMGSHEKYFLKSNEEMKLKDVVELYLKVNNMQVKLKWGERPHSSRDFFQSLNILDVLAGWEPQVLLADGLKNL